MFPDHLLQFFAELGQNVDSLILDERQENRTFSVHLLLVLLEYHHVEIPGYLSIIKTIPIQQTLKAGNAEKVP